MKKTQQTERGSYHIDKRKSDIEMRIERTSRRDGCCGEGRTTTTTTTTTTRVKETIRPTRPCETCHIVFIKCLFDMDTAITLDRPAALFECFSTGANSQHLKVIFLLRP